MDFLSIGDFYILNVFIMIDQNMPLRKQQIYPLRMLYLILSAARTKASSARIECLASHNKMRAIIGRQDAK